MSPRAVPRSRLLTLVCMVCLVGLLLAGCGDSGDSGDDGEPPEPAYDDTAAAPARLAQRPARRRDRCSYQSDFGPYTDYGLSIDAALALDELGDDDAVQETSDAVAANLDAYISGEAFGDPGSTYAGPAAKALVIAQARRRRPHGVRRCRPGRAVEAVTTQGGPAAGRIADVSKFGDYANILGQAFAVQGLDEADSARCRRPRLPAEPAVLRRVLPVVVHQGREGRRPVLRRGQREGEPAGRRHHRRRRARAPGGGRRAGRGRRRHPGHRLAGRPAVGRRRVHRQRRHGHRERQQHRSGGLGARGERRRGGGRERRDLGQVAAGRRRRRVRAVGRSRRRDRLRPRSARGRRAGRHHQEDRRAVDALDSPGAPGAAVGAGRRRELGLPSSG